MDQKLIAMAIDEINDLTSGSFLEDAHCIPFLYERLKAKRKLNPPWRDFAKRASQRILKALLEKPGKNQVSCRSE